LDSVTWTVGRPAGLRRDHAGRRLGGAALLHRLPHLLSGQLLRLAVLEGVHQGKFGAARCAPPLPSA
jgi:hypothetical protein